MNSHSFAVAIIYLALTSSLLGCQDGKPKEFAQPSTYGSITANAVKPALTREEALKVRGTCVLKPERVVRLKSQIGGEVKSVLVQQGQQVLVGDIMATIDVENLILRHARTTIELEKLLQRAELLKFQVERAEREMAVVRDLTGGQSISSGRFSKEMSASIERRIDLKDNELNQALTKLDLKVLDSQIRKAAIRSPFSGIVLSRAVEPGTVVGSGIESVAGSEVLFEVADPNKLVASCIIKEADATLLTLGATATVIVDGNSKKAQRGTVGRISPIISNQSGFSRREFSVDLPVDRKSSYLPGMNAVVEFDVN